MLRRLFSLTFLLFLTFLFEIAFVRYLPVPFDADSLIGGLKIGIHSDSISDFQFPVGRRKTAPEIRKYIHSSLKQEGDIASMWDIAKLMFGGIIPHENKSLLGYVNIDSMYMQAFIFDHRFLIQKYVVRIHIVPRLV